MSRPSNQLLDDICVRFILSLPTAELECAVWVAIVRGMLSGEGSVEIICSVVGNVCVCELTLPIRRHRSFERLLFCIEQAWWHYEVI